jgi:HK97 family phage portal protein
MAARRLALTDFLRRPFSYLFRQKAVVGLYTYPPAWTTISGPGGDFSQLCQEFYEKNSLIFACVEELATSAGDPRLVVELSTPEGWVEADDDHPLVELLAKPNPGTTSYGFWHDTTMYEAIAGKMYWEKVRAAAGRVVELWPITPDRVKPILSEDPRRKKLMGWDVSFSSGEPLRMEPEDLIPFRRTHPRKPLDGLAPLEVVAKEAGLDGTLTDYVSTFFKNGAVPYGLLITKQRTDEAEQKRIRERLKQKLGPNEWHNMLILDDTQAEYKQFGLPPDQLEMSSVREVSESRICMAFQVPPQLVGALVGVNPTYSNYKEARRSFWEETLSPIYTDHADTINLYLAPEFGDGVRVRWDFSGVAALQEDINKTHERVRLDFTAGYITVNEARQAIGEAPVIDGDIFLRPFNLIAAEAQLESEKGIPRVIVSKAEPLSLTAGTQETLEFIWWKALDTTARRFEDPFQRAARTRFQEDRSELLKILRKRGKAAKDGVPFISFEEDALTYLLNNGKDGWRQTFVPLFTALLEAQGENIAATFGIDFSVDTPEVQAFLEQYTMTFSEALFEVDAAKVNELVAEAQAEGWSVPKLREAINETWDFNEKVRAERIARTETIRSSNAGATEAMRLSGIEMVKWLTAQDDRVCPWCEEMGKRPPIEIGRVWFSEGDQMTVYDSEGKGRDLKLIWDVGYPPLHVDCRCTVLAVFEEV